MEDNETNQASSSAMRSPDRRSTAEDSVRVEPVLFPLLGTRRGDQVSFEYLPVAVTASEVHIASPSWVVSREFLTIGDVIDLNIGVLPGLNGSAGVIHDTYADETLDGDVHVVTLRQERQGTLPVRLGNTDGQLYLTGNYTTLAKAAEAMLDDVVLVKRGVDIYLRHLIPYFSRISTYSAEDYPVLQDQLFGDIQLRLLDNVRYLSTLASTVGRLEDPSQLPSVIDLELLRRSLESELYLDLFRITFEDALPVRYLESIKKLEVRLYRNYNAILVAMLRAL